MLLGERADGEDPVVAGGITVYRDLVAGSLGVRSVAVDEVGDAQLVVLCPDRHGPLKVEALAADARRKVIVLGVSRDNVLAYWEAGAYSVLTEETTIDDLRIAVERAARDECEIPTDVARFLIERLRALKALGERSLVGRLTPRELEVATLMAEGLRNKQIAERLWISQATVKKHANKVLASSR